VFCFFRDGARTPGHIRYDVRKTSYLDGEVILEAIREFKKIGVKAITFVGGGEPLLHPEIEGILQKVIEADIKFGIITNLSKMIHPDLLAKASWIRVSVDAAESHTYERVHNPGSNDFEVVKENIRRLRNKVDLGVSFVVCKENWGEIYKAAELFKEMGVNYIQFKPAYDVDKGESIMPYMEEIEMLLRRAQKLATDGFEVIDMMHRVKELSTPNRNFILCRIHNYNTQIGSDGNVYPCCVLKYIEEYSYGSLYESGFEEVWQGRRRREVIERLTGANCPPCWYDKTNEVLEYLSNKEAKHKEFV
jgi:radical SAM protein with 4Fe4S-binding SPASM domain